MRMRVVCRTSTYVRTNNTSIKPAKFIQYNNNNNNKSVSFQINTYVQLKKEVCINEYVRTYDIFLHLRSSLKKLNWKNIHNKNKKRRWWKQQQQYNSCIILFFDVRHEDRCEIDDDKHNCSAVLNFRNK